MDECEGTINSMKLNCEKESLTILNHFYVGDVLLFKMQQDFQSQSNNESFY